MAEALDRLLEHVSAYELLNNLLPGATYVLLAERLTSLRLLSGSVWLDLALCYAVGLAIGRVGSLVVEPLLQRLKLLDRVPHSDYVKAEGKERRVREVSTVNNMYRTFAAVAACLLLTICLSMAWPHLRERGATRQTMGVAGCVALMVLFALSHAKQTSLVASRVRAVNKEESTTDLIMPGDG